ncbi:MAG: hypothetical protein IT581_21785 [Verrucomicrobiales bacterium]|nr:hypothetical protein [Verrucomicrobiales bacterium]
MKTFLPQYAVASLATCLVFGGLTASGQLGGLRIPEIPIPGTGIPIPGTKPKPTKEQDPDQALNEAKQKLETDSGGVVNSAEAVRYLQGIMSKITPTSAFRGLQVRILRDGRLETTSLPDGTVYVTTGLLMSLSNEAELAAALANECVLADIKARDYEALMKKRKDDRGWKLILAGLVGSGVGVAVSRDHGATAGVLAGALSAGGAFWLTEYLVPSRDNRVKGTNFYKRLSPADRAAFDQPYAGAMKWMKLGGYPPGQFLSFSATLQPGDVDGQRVVQTEFRANYSQLDPLVGLNPTTYKRIILQAAF